MQGWYRRPRNSSETRALSILCSAAWNSHPQGYHMVQEASWTSSHHSSTRGRWERTRGRARRSEADPCRQPSWNAHNALPRAYHWPQLSHVLHQLQGENGTCSFLPGHTATCIKPEFCLQGRGKGHRLANGSLLEMPTCKGLSIITG